MTPPLPPPPPPSVNRSSAADDGIEGAAERRRSDRRGRGRRRDRRRRRSYVAAAVASAVVLSPLIGMAATSMAARPPPSRSPFVVRAALGTIGPAATSASASRAGGPSDTAAAALLHRRRGPSRPAAAAFGRGPPPPPPPWSSQVRLLSASSSTFPPPRGWDSLTSTKSPSVKLFRSLLSRRRKRAELGLAVVEGMRAVLDGLSDPRTRRLFRHVIVTESALEHAELGGRLREALAEAQVEGEEEEGGGGGGAAMMRVSSVTEEVLTAATDTVTPQGVAATVSIPPPYDGPTDDGGRGRRSGGMYLILDALSDPGNVGTLLRTSLAVGASAVLLLPGSCDVWNPKVVRSAAGAALRVPVRAAGSLEECLELLGRWGVDVEGGGAVWAATMEGSGGAAAVVGGEGGGSESRAHYDVDWVSPPDAASPSSPSSSADAEAWSASALIVGREGEGLSPSVRDAVRKGAIRSVHVPMEEGVESLNAAVCGSVILFEYMRQKRLATASAPAADD